MPRLHLHPSSGTGIISPYTKAIRLARYGCANRPFYHIVVMDAKKEQRKPPIEQLGTYDPIPNAYNEKLVSFNYERIQYWLAKGVQISKPIADLLGLAGFLPIYPKTYLRAWRNRKLVKENFAEKSMPQEKTMASES